MPTHYVYIDLPSDVKIKLEELQSSLEEDARKLNLEKISAGKAHITLGVFNLSEEAEKKSLEELIQISEEISSNAIRAGPRINIKLNGLDHFGGRVLFIEIERSEELLNFRETLITDFENSGMMSARNFHPHVTLFKVKQKESVEKREEKVNDIITKTNVPTFRNFPINAVYLKEI